MEFEFPPFVVDLEILPGPLQHAPELLIVVGRLVVGEDDPLHPRLQGHVHAGEDVAVAPVLLLDVLQHGVLGVEDQQVGALEKPGERLQCVLGEVLVLRVGGVDHRFLPRGEPVAVTVPGMDQRRRPHRHPADGQLVPLADPDEPVGLCEGNRKELGKLLDLQPLLQVVLGPIDGNPVVGIESRNKERQPRDMIPVGVGEKNVGLHRFVAGAFGEFQAEPPDPGPGIEDDQGLPVADLHAGRIAAGGSPHRPGEIPDERLDLGLSGRFGLQGHADGRSDFLGKLPVGQRGGHGTADAPKSDVHHPSPIDCKGSPLQPRW